MMTKADVLESFNIALLQPGAGKSGNLLADELRRRASQFVSVDRQGLVDAVGEWLESREDVRVIQAAVLIREFRLKELLEPMTRIRAEVASGAFMQPSSCWIFDRAIEKLV